MLWNSPWLLLLAIIVLFIIFPYFRSRVLQIGQPPRPFSVLFRIFPSLQKKLLEYLEVKLIDLVEFVFFSSDLKRLARMFVILAAVIFVVGYTSSVLDTASIIKLPTIIAVLVNNYVPNIATELVSISLTVLIVDEFVRRRSEKAERETLILQLGSPIRSVAVEAARVLRARGWKDLAGAQLSGADLSGANLSGINMRLEEADLSHTRLVGAYLKDTVLDRANLESADLTNADMREVHLSSANLSCAVLRSADLSIAHMYGALLYEADLRGAKLYDARLRGADLRCADLRDTNLYHVDFTDANLQGAKLNGTENMEYVTLPDGTEYDPEIDLKRFTDLDHPQAWKCEE